MCSVAIEEGDGLICIACTFISLKDKIEQCVYKLFLVLIQAFRTYGLET